MKQCSSATLGAIALDIWMPLEPQPITPTLEEAQELVMNALKQQERDQRPSKILPGRIREIYKIMRAMLGGRKLMYGSCGYIGTVPQPTQKGDEFCVLLGCHTPTVLRRVINGVFRIVGECYVLGISEDPNAKIQLKPEQLHSVSSQMREFDIV